MRGAISIEHSEPFISRTRSTTAHSVHKVTIDSGRNQKLGIIRPTVVALGETSFLFAEQLSVRGSFAGLVWSAAADVTVEHDKSRPVFSSPEDLEGVLDAMNVVRVSHAQNVPPISEKAGSYVLGESDIRVALR